MHNGNVNTSRPHALGARRRRGISSILAMLFLVLFGTLAIGFYASTTITVQISANDERTSRAQLAAESGMDFMRRHLAILDVPTIGTPTRVLEELHARLKARLEGTENLGPNTLGWDGSTITIPAIDLGNQASFSGRIVLVNPAATRPDIRVTVTGTASDSSARCVEMVFVLQERRTAIFDYGVATRSSVLMDSNARIRGATDPSRGKLLITSDANPALTMVSNPSISGTVSLVNDNKTVTMSSNASINGTTTPIVGSDIKLGVDEPEFPVVDTSPFLPYAGNPLYGGLILTLPNVKYDTADLKNILIKANTNPTFSGNIRLDGVIYIETPNKVTFDSNVRICGVIAVQNDPTGSVSSNQIKFLSNTTIQGVDALPATVNFPPALRALTGSLILAPTFKLHFDSNFGAAGGSIVASEMHFGSNARGEIAGSIINLDQIALRFDSNADIAIKAPLNDQPAGLQFGGNFMPDASTYTEGS